MAHEDPNTLIPRLCMAYKPFDSLLDVGSGGGIVGLNHWGVDLDRIHTFDIYPPETPWRNFTLGNALDADEIFGCNSFDLVQAAELIEHLPKEKGFELLKVLEMVARKLVVLTTPNGFLEQDPEKVPNEPWAKNPYQKHLCGWTPQEFMKLGYAVYLNGDHVTGFEVGDQIIAWKSVI